MSDNFCSEKPLPIQGLAHVIRNERLRPNVYKLVIALGCGAQKLPVPGQFYMLRSAVSGVLLGRPVSLFHARAVPESGEQYLEFLILQKGRGTGELCSLVQGSAVFVLGPLGNSFPMPCKAVPDIPSPRLLLIGGGIGIVPPAGFAALLPAGSYDFFACFRSGVYGLEYIQPRTLVVATDDGSSGIKGMLPDVLDAGKLRRSYDAVYACGPEPMLGYVHRICDQAGVPCWLSLESRMACGTGVCLGCSILTAEGNKRCCSDGPVFSGRILSFPIREARLPSYRKRTVLHDTAEADISAEICGIHFANPVIAASGTFGYGREYKDIIDIKKLGGICSKGLTLVPREGNGGIRLYETPSGLINSIGLENPGIEHFIAHELPEMLAMGPAVIANLSGSSVEEYAEGARLLDGSGVQMIELNISCPNVKAGGMAFGLDCGAAAEVVAAVRKMTSKPLMVKLSPNAGDLGGIAYAVREAGADALSLVNTFQAMAIDIETGRPVFSHIRAGLSGPAVRPIALRMVYDVVQEINKLPEAQRIPVVGIGGICAWQDALEFIMAGAAAVQIGTATFSRPSTMIDIIEGISSFMRRNGIRDLAELRGCAQVY